MTMNKITADTLFQTIAATRKKESFLQVMTDAVGGVEVPEAVITGIATLLNEKTDATQQEITKVKNVLSASVELPYIVKTAAARFDNNTNLDGNKYTATLAGIRAVNEGHKTKAKIKAAIEAATQPHDPKVKAKEEMLMLLRRAATAATKAGNTAYRGQIDKLIAKA